MLTKNEITSLNLSPTKKDFVQIWNELLEVAGKLSERWDPTSTNESDPGIVILKALTGIADKLNYNIDKNILEAFMPTAAQEDSMRKLCDMLGYNIKYYQSAVTEVTIKWHNPEPSEDESAMMSSGTLSIPKFAVVTNSDQDISYFLIPDNDHPVPAIITSEDASKIFKCMEGQLVKCESINDNNVITARQISENNRFYLPEVLIAENGIFIYNIFNDPLNPSVLADGTPWHKVDNLNIHHENERVYKFGFDSYEGRPYIEFPENYAELFGDGIFLYYTRTNGAAGNISARTLTKFEAPSEGNWSKVSAESFNVENAFAATTGANVETIKQAYNNFKKTIGTFETLVTCRDYMNKIYSMTSSLGKPLVSNVLVTDIRNDLNRAVTICSCDHAGIFYKESSRFSDTPVSDITKPFFDGETWRLNNKNGPKLTNFVADPSFKADATGEISYKQGYWTITQDNVEFITNLSVGPTTNAIDHFDLILYPFKSYNQIKNNVKDVRQVYDSSFTYSPKTFNTIKDELDDSDIKTVAHKLKSPRGKTSDGTKISVGDIVSINNYLKLDAVIATNSKITVEEGSIIKDKIKIALANAFNMRELDFGEEIPFDSIVEVIEGSDSRIRIAALNEPALYTTFSVFEDIGADGNPIIKEYAVASDWLSLEDAIKTNRFDTDKYENVGTKDKPVLKSLSTFNSKEARELYNKLALRNILAGRLPLFNYNDTFKTSFSESAYQTTTEITPADIANVLANINLPVPSKDNPFTMIVSDGVTYTARCVELKEKPIELTAPTETDPETNYYLALAAFPVYLGYWNEGTPLYFKIIYSKTGTPDAFLKNNISNVITSINNNNITDISTTCDVLTTEGKIEDFELASGEYIRFRAPNFTTTKTYPAYVNYHLALDKAVINNAENAEAETLFDLLNKDKDSWSLENTNIAWQKVFDYFKKYNDSYVVSAVQSQPVTGYSESGETSSGVSTGPIVVTVDENTDDETKDLPTLLSQSGCLKFSDSHNITYNAASKRYEIEALVAWKKVDGEADRTGKPDLTIKVSLSSPFITESSLLTKINEAVQARLEGMVGQFTNSGDPILPIYDWTISFEYECVPFTAAALSTWSDFIKNHAEELFGKTPKSESGIIFWRAYGEGYAAGKYIQADSSKLLKFESNYFGNLPADRLRGIYLIWNLGKDTQTAIISNDTEYRLRANEYLYIEYTPSSTSEDGTTKEGAAITEILGPGTIIRPSGFEAGLMDSSEYFKQGHSYHKTAQFETASGLVKDIEMHRFGANEQVEIRDFAKVTLNKDTFKATPIINYYKNFNNCAPLEDPKYTGPRTYTLKDGEYIFYTDNNKADLAYFTTGTQVTLTGDILFEQFETIELNTIFDSGLADIPWKPLSFSSADDKAVFQEFQYITLGSGDKIERLKLTGATGDGGTVGTNRLNSTWQYCDEVEYLTAGAEQPTPLPKIDTYEARLSDQKGCGWEVCSVLELDVTYNAEQLLRSTDQIETSITLKSKSPIGIDTDDAKLEIKPEGGHALAFKTNLSCQPGSDHINIDDVSSNAKKLKGFELKLFAKETPAIVQTAPGKVCPYKSSITDITNWPGIPVTIKESSTPWTEIDLDNIREGKTSKKLVDYDQALRLPISVLPNTYGVFTIYVNYTSANTELNKTWIEVLPGTSSSDITLFNVPENEVVWETAAEDSNNADKLILKPGINCIKINTTGRIFIKTLGTSQGTLHFDELKLVNAAPLYYTIPATKDTEAGTLPLSTYGLNIEQSGYLNVNDVTTLDNITQTTLVIDADAKDQYISDCVEEAKIELADLYRTATDSFNTKAAKLADTPEKLKSLLDLAKAIKADLTKLKTSINGDSARAASYAALLGKYKEILLEYTNETSLKDALEDSASIEALETAFAAIIDNKSVTLEYQQKLLDELDTLYANTTSEIKSLDKASVLAHFESMKSISEDTITSIQNASRKLVEADYEQRVAPLMSEVDQLVNSEEKTKLLATLNTLNSEAAAQNQDKLLTTMKQITDVLDKDTLDNLLVTIVASATSGSFAEVDADLMRLRIYLSDLGIAPLVSELEQAANEADNVQLKELVNKLNKLVETNNKWIDGIDGITGIKDLSEQLQEEYLKQQEEPSTVPSPDLISAVKELCVGIADDYKTTLTSLLEVIHKVESVDDKETASGLITDIEKSNNDAALTDTLQALKTSENAAISAIAKELADLTAARAAQLGLIEVFSSGKIAQYDQVTTLPFGTEAVYSVWREHLQSALDTKVNTLYKSIKAAILTLESSPSETDEITVDLLVDDSSTKLLPKATKYFEDLSSKIKNLNGKQEQKSTQANFVDALELPIAAELAAALSSLNNNAYKARNPVIHSLVSKYLDTKTTSLNTKRQITKDLKEELQNNISTKEQLITAIENIICPNLLQLKTKLSAAFDTEVDSKDNLDLVWYNALKEYKYELLNADEENPLNIVLASIEDHLETLITSSLEATLYEALTANTLNEWLTSKYNTGASILLTDSMIQVLKDLRAIAVLQKEYSYALDVDFTSEDFEDFKEWLKNNPTITDKEVKEILRTLSSHLEYLKANLAQIVVDAEHPDNKAVFDHYIIEQQLLRDIKELDINRDFYYTAPTDFSLAIEFNDSNSDLNTLANPATNYDINNINNNFVISKLDIDYLDNGLQIARSSRLN